MKACCVVNSGRSCQESYETESRDAGRRARQVRKLGYRASVCSIGPQVTPAGIVKLSMVTIQPGQNEDTCDLPHMDRVEWN